MKKYRLFPQDDLALLKIIQELKIRAWMWPSSNNEPDYFDVDVDEAQLLVLKLRTPFTFVKH